MMRKAVFVCLRPSKEQPGRGNKLKNLENRKFGVMCFSNLKVWGTQ